LGVFITGERALNALLPVQPRSSFVDHFLIYFSIFTFDAIVLRCAARLASELTISGHYIVVLV
jgi:hypothetical protein